MICTFAKKHTVTNKIKHILLLLTTLLALSSCYNRDGRERLARAQTLLENGYADSAANVLDSLYLPAEMGKKYYMQYLVTRVQAKYKAYREVKNDTAVMEAVRYYEKKNNHPEQIAQANYLAGCVIRERGENKRAIPYFKKALTFSNLTNDHLQQGLCLENLAYIYDAEMLEDQAIDYYHKAYTAYKKQTDTERKQINVLNQLAINFLKDKNIDSAFVYYDKCKKIAIALNDSNEIASILNNIGVAHQTSGKYSTSIIMLEEANKYQPNQNLKNKINLNIASNYILLKQKNLARKYINELRQSIETSIDIYYKSAVLALLSDFEKQEGNYIQALSYSDQERQLQLDILNANQSKALIEAEKEYDFTQKELEAEKAKLIQRNSTIIFIIFVVGIIIVGLMLRKRNILQQEIKETALIHEKNRKETENKALAERLQLLNYSANQYKTLATHTQTLHSSIFDIAEAGWFKENSKQFEKIIKALQSTENAVIVNMGDIAKSYFKDRYLLSETIVDNCSHEELILLYRLYINDSRNDIAALFNIKPHALTQRISRLKEKLKPLLSESDFKAFFH